MDFPPWQTVYWQFKQWEKRQVTERILDLLREEVRLVEGRDPLASPDAWSAGVETFSVLILRLFGSRLTRKASWSVQGGGRLSGPGVAHLVPAARP
ncbi:transposase [Micromonospora sp. NPDC050397]|uniref:transposase n=1 Tax=Micromonospora sp. NPDC050397 TaxID=3364279 RepID=UPI00384D5647